MSFAESLNARDRRLVARLEGLGDVVVGFAMSQLVVQLPQAGAAVHVRNLFGAMAYFGTFAVLVMLWLAFHRMMTSGFTPGAPDLFLAFVFLAFTSLMPYAMNSIITGQRAADTNGAAATSGTAVYAGCFFVTLATSSVIWWRNLRRGWHHFERDERDAVWFAALRSSVVGALMLAVLIVDLTAGSKAASYTFISFFVATVVLRTRFRKAPSAERLRIPAQAAGG